MVKVITTHANSFHRGKTNLSSHSEQSERLKECALLTCWQREGTRLYTISFSDYREQMPGLSMRHVVMSGADMIVQGHEATHIL